MIVDGGGCAAESASIRAELLAHLGEVHVLVGWRQPEVAHLRMAMSLREARMLVEALWGQAGVRPRSVSPIPYGGGTADEQRIADLECAARIAIKALFAGRR